MPKRAEQSVFRMSVDNSDIEITDIPNLVSSFRLKSQASVQINTSHIDKPSIHVEGDRWPDIF